MARARLPSGDQGCQGGGKARGRKWARNKHQSTKACLFILEGSWQEEVGSTGRGGGRHVQNAARRLLGQKTGLGRAGIRGRVRAGRRGLEQKPRLQRSKRSGRSRESKLMTQSLQMSTWVRPWEASHPDGQAGLTDGRAASEASRLGGEGAVLTRSCDSAGGEPLVLRAPVSRGNVGTLPSEGDALPPSSSSPQLFPLLPFLPTVAFLELGGPKGLFSFSSMKDPEHLGPSKQELRAGTAQVGGDLQRRLPDQSLPLSLGRDPLTALQLAAAQPCEPPVAPLGGQV